MDRGKQSLVCRISSASSNDTRLCRRRYACCWHTKSSTQRTSSFFAGITSVLLSTASMASMMNVSCCLHSAAPPDNCAQASVGTIFDSGKLSPTASTACLSPQLLMRKSFAYTADCRPTLSTWKKCGASRVQQTYQTKVSFRNATFARRHALCCSQGLLCDLLWSDPEKQISGWGDNDRGVSFTFGHDVVTGFLEKHDLDLVCRAHQVCPASLPASLPCTLSS